VLESARVLVEAYNLGVSRSEGVSLVGVPRSQGSRWKALWESEHRAEPGRSHFERHRGHAEKDVIARPEYDVRIEGEQRVIFGTFGSFRVLKLGRLGLHDEAAREERR